MLRLGLLDYLELGVRLSVTGLLIVTFFSATVIVSIKTDRSLTAQKVKLLLTAVTAVLVISGLNFEQRLRKNTAYTGVPYLTVQKVAAHAVSDSSLISSGKYLTEALLLRTFSVSGIESSAAGKILIFSSDEPKVRRGELFSVSGSMMKPETSDAGLSFHKQDLFLFFPNSDRIERTGWSSEIYRIRSGILDTAEDRLMKLEKGAGGILLALFTGSRNMMERSDTELFRSAGAAHILALSGMHLGLLCGLIYFILIPLTGKRPAFIICSVIVVLYLFLTGFGESLVRAAIMFFLIGLNEQLSRRASFTDILMLSFVIMTIIIPEAYFSVSFRLSFLAIAGMVYIGGLFIRILPLRLPRWFRLSISASAGAQSAVIPIVLSVFGKVYPAGLISGIILTPLVTLFIWFGLLFLITGWEMLSICIEFIYKIIRMAAEMFSALPFFGIDKFLIAGTLVFYSVPIFTIIILIIRERYNELSVKL